MKNRREIEKRRLAERENDTRRAKEVEFFAASVNAWYNTALEHDKSIFALSAGGIGLLITLITAVGVESMLMFSLYVAAILCFFLCLISILIIFNGNRNHIMEVVVNGKDDNDSGLARLDLAARYLFGAGAFFAVIVGIAAAHNSYLTKGNDMANDKQSKQPAGTTTMAYDSVNGCGAFAKSFNGIGKIQSAFNGHGGASTSQTSQTTQQSTQQPAAPKPNSGR